MGQAFCFKKSMTENWNKTPDKFKDVFKLQSRYNRITAKKRGNDDGVSKRKIIRRKSV